MGLAMTPLTEDEKREIVRRFRELHAAIIHSQPDLNAKFKSFQTIYRGSIRPFVDDFPNARDKAVWVGQLGAYLMDEIGEPSFWRLPRRDD